MIKQFSHSVLDETNVTYQAWAGRALFDMNYLVSGFHLENQIFNFWMYLATQNDCDWLVGGMGR